jgi:LPXTG-motif cell wall-anchored protein
MSAPSSPLQLGGAVVLGAAAARTGARAVSQGFEQLPVTGAAALAQLSMLGGSLVTAGALVLRRGKRARRDAGHSFD